MGKDLFKNVDHDLIESLSALIYYLSMKHNLPAGIWKKIVTLIACGILLTACNLSLERIKTNIDQFLTRRATSEEVTRIIEVTRIVEITVVVTQTYTATATVTPTPVKPQEPVPNHPFIVTKLPP